ncbi:MAG TPA: SDR family oxidoreductase [Acetobacteraceae bacterium]|nr:SDR family oxidoreductase [Acetobacteraceae bacterium]
MSPLFDLTGKAAVVTGGNGGIGLGIVEGLIEAGAQVLIVGRDKLKNGEAAAKTGAGAFAADVTDPAQCRAAVAECERLFGRLDILVNNAGTNIRNRPEALDPADWHKIIDTNLTSTHLMCQAAYPLLKREGGKVINIGSMMSIFGVPFSPAYAASKGGVVQYTKVLATAWAEDDIQANAILPGWIDTELTRGARRQIDGLHDRVLARTPAARWGEPRDMAGLAIFLAAPASDFITGTAIPADGGYSALG